MPSNKIHCRTSKDRTKLDFKELHEWIDKDENNLGVNHRLNRHAYNTKEEKQIKDYWEKKRKGLGDKAVVEWLFHIALDNLETAFKKAEKTYRFGSYTFFKFGLVPNSKFIYYDFKKLKEKELLKEFGDVYYENE